jgi:hypothetical protein
MRRASRLRRSPLRLAALGVLAALAGACSSDGPSAPPAGEVAPLDVGALLQETAVPAVPGVAAGVPFVAPAAVPIPTSCPYDAASKSFVCPPTTSGGLTVSLAYTLLDAAGKPLAQADKNVVASIRTVSTAKGTITAPAESGASGTITVDQRQELTLSGLLTGTHRVDGTGTTKIDGTLTVGGLKVPLTSTMTQTVAGLVLPTGAAAGKAPWPTAGTITVDATTAGAGLPATTLRSQLTFNGTSTATLTITIGGVTQRCTVNLANPSQLTCTG